MGDDAATTFSVRSRRSTRTAYVPARASVAVTEPRLSVRRTTLPITLPLALTRSTATLTLRSPLTLTAICSPAPYGAPRAT